MICKYILLIHSVIGSNNFISKNSILHNSFVCTQFKRFIMSHLFSQFKCRTVLFGKKSRTLSGATTPGKSSPGSDDKEVVLCIPQSSRITCVSQSDCLISYRWVGGSYPSAEMQTAYSTTPADWATLFCAAFNKDSVSFFMFYLLCSDQTISCTTSLVCHTFIFLPIFFQDFVIFYYLSFI